MMASPPWAETMLRNLGRIFCSKASLAVFGVLLLIQLGVSFAGWNSSDPAPWQTWGLSLEGIKQGRIWQVASHALIHGSVSHFLVNALGLLVIGSRIEHISGAKALLVSCGVGIVGGAVGHLLLGSGILVGFSGALFALWMLLVSLSPQSRMVPLVFCPGVWLGWGILGISMILALSDPKLGLSWMGWVRELIPAGAGEQLYQIGHACHFGGGIGGWLVGCWLLRPTVTLKSLQNQRVRREGRAAKRDST